MAVETSQKIAERRVNPDIVPFPDTQFTGALGVLIFTKIAEGALFDSQNLSFPETFLSSSSEALSGESQVDIKTQALERLVALCKGEGTAKENLYLSIQKKVFPELAFNLSDADATIRRLATEVLVYFASQYRQSTFFLLKATGFAPLCFVNSLCRLFVREKSLADRGYHVKTGEVAVR